MSTTADQTCYLIRMLSGWTFWPMKDAVSRIVQFNLSKQNSHGHGNAAKRRAKLLSA